MLSFLANNIEQLDLALEHIAKGDVNNARFGLLLTDNVVEITLHQLALDRQSDMKHSTYKYEKTPFPYMKELEAALQRNFEPKVKFAIVEGKLSATEGTSVHGLHDVRNEVYHIGVRDGVVLPELARFYFHLATIFLGRYEPRYFSWGSAQKIPDRASKYFQGDCFMPGRREDYAEACKTLNSRLAFEAGRLIGALADRLDRVIDQEDAAVDLLSQVPTKKSRDRAVVEIQAWSFAFTDKGKEFVSERLAGGDAKPSGMSGFIDMICQHYPFEVRRDPIPSWRQRAENLRKEADAHKALVKYRNFMTQTEDLRALLDEAHGYADAYVDEQIERMRGR